MSRQMLYYRFNHHSDIKKHWHKLKYFSPQFADQKPGDDIIIMDIDQVIISNVDDLLVIAVKEKELLSYDPWWSNNNHWKKSYKEDFISLNQVVLKQDMGRLFFKSRILAIALL